MSDRRRPGVRDQGERGVRAGPGALCAQAQADGVPCTEVGRDCEVCPKAEQNLHIAHAADLAPPPDQAPDPSSADW